MATVDGLGDLGYSFEGTPTGARYGYGATALSSTLELVPNPDFADSFAGLTTAEIEMAQIAYNIFHRPFAMLAGLSSGEDFTKYNQIYTPEEAARAIGAAEVGELFKYFRRAAGERIYGGMDLVVSDEEVRIPLDEYLEMASYKKIPVNKYLGTHDIDTHMVGGLLTEPSLGDVIALCCQQILKTGTRNAREAAARAVDFIVSDIKTMWAAPHQSESSHGKIANRLSLLMRNQDLQIDFLAPVSMSIAQGQVEFIDSLQRKKLFVQPETARKAGAMAIAQ